MVHIVTGPTHCGKSTYIEEMKNPEDIHFDIYDLQKDKQDLISLTQAQYEFLFYIEDAVRNLNSDLWIEGCWSNPYRIAQIIDTVCAANPHVEIEVYYILRSNEWFDEYLDELTGLYAKEQNDYYELYDPTKHPTAALYIIGDENTRKERVEYFT